MHKAMKHSKLYTPIVVLTLLIVSCNSAPKDELNQALTKLDEAIALREDVATLKQEHINLNISVLDNKHLTYSQRIEMVEDLIDLYDKYQLDSTLMWLHHGITLAEKNNDSKRATSLKLKTSKMYSAAGFYDEANMLLMGEDTTKMDAETIRDYYLAAHSYHREMREYSPSTSIKTHSAQREEYYMDRLIATETDSLEKHKLLCTKYGNLSDWDNLSKELDIVLPTLSPESEEFAYYSYLKALSVGDERGTPEEYMTHLALSARADMRSCNTDHASLSMLSEVLFYRGDVERAFRYITISLEDASFYNSRLRPWQVAAMLPIIENSYSEEIRKQQNRLTISIVAISLLLVCILLFSLQRSRRARQMEIAKMQLEEMNKRLEEYVTLLSEQNIKEHQLSADLSEANAVKEQYIALFLVICSNYIDQFKSYHNNVRKRLSKGSVESLQKELDSSSLIDNAEREFYTNFDNAFLNLYPMFVEEFNALLKDDSQITLKNPRVLNTELRIFALIKLGITDSSRIASLLRYSVNTIYNYRSGVKNNSKVSREDFEERVRRIGSKELTNTP